MSSQHQGPCSRPSLSSNDIHRWQRCGSSWASSAKSTPRTCPPWRTGMLSQDMSFTSVGYCQCISNHNRKDGYSSFPLFFTFLWWPQTNPATDGGRGHSRQKETKPDVYHRHSHTVAGPLFCTWCKHLLWCNWHIYMCWGEMTVFFWGTAEHNYACSLYTKFSLRTQVTIIW